MKRPLALCAFVLACSVISAAEGVALPTIEMPPAQTDTSAPLLIMLTGDGGWAEFVREISRRLAADNWAVVALDLRRYLWTRRTPEETADAVARLAREYGAKWHRTKVVIAGFSRGADLAPFVVNRLPAALQNQVALVVLLSPGAEAEFEFHVIDFLRDPRKDGSLPVLPEIQKLTRPTLLFYGEDDHEALPRQPTTGALHVVRFPGDHHLGRDYARIVDLIRAGLRLSAR